MSLYAYIANNNVCRDNKLHFFWCNECGSFDLKNPRNSESDHRDVLRFTCNNCGIHPYHHWMDESDLIKVTKENAEEIKNRYFTDRNLDPKKYWFNDEILRMIHGDNT